jgi:hypothetical protein
MKHAVIVGKGANEDEAIIMVAESIEQATEFVENLPFSKKIQDGYYDIEGGLEEDDELDVLFTSYYEGCGGCYALEIKEVESLTPSIAWNRD